MVDGAPPEPRSDHRREGQRRDQQGSGQNRADPSSQRVGGEGVALQQRTRRDDVDLHERGRRHHRRHRRQRIVGLGTEPARPAPRTRCSHAGLACSGLAHSGVACSGSSHTGFACSGSSHAGLACSGCSHAGPGHARCRNKAARPSTAQMRQPDNGSRHERSQRRPQTHAVTEQRQPTQRHREQRLGDEPATAAGVKVRDQPTLGRPQRLDQHQLPAQHQRRRHHEDHIDQTEVERPQGKRHDQRHRHHRGQRPKSETAIANRSPRRHQPTHIIGCPTTEHHGRGSGLTRRRHRADERRHGLQHQERTQVCAVQHHGQHRRRRAEGHQPADTTDRGPGRLLPQRHATGRSVCSADFDRSR